jgi:hypothetical protein
MAAKDKMVKKIDLSGLGIGGYQKDAADNSIDETGDVMTDPRYLRQSSALVNEALQKGFNVLQMANGDIVTTGVKTVTYQYTWDAEKGKLVRSKGAADAKRLKKKSDMMDDSFEDEIEEV